MKYAKVESIPTEQAWLQFTSRRTGTEEVQVDYELVLPLTQYDCRGVFDDKGASQSPKSHRVVWLDKNNCKRLPLGRTNVGTRNKKYPFSQYCDEIDVPFRDGAHALWDSERLGGLKTYYVVGDGFFELLPVKGEATA